jgi:hypothetical protein
MSSGTLTLIAVGAGGLLLLGCLIAAFRALWRKRLIDDSPTSKTQGVFIGLTELKGTAETETPLNSYLGEVKCVQYKWQIQEHWSRTVTETYTDAQGRTHTRTRTESGWATVASGGQAAPFYLKDDTGVIRILPENASIEGNTTFDQTCSRDNALYFGKGPEREVANSNHRRRFRETAIPLHAMLYVMGQARERQDVVAAEIACDKSAPMFLISTRTEKQVSARFGRWFWLWLILGLVVSSAAALAWQLLQTLSPLISWQPFVIAVGGFLVVLGLGWVWAVYNSFVNLHHRVEQAWSQVEVQLKRRHDLIPNLVQAVEGYRTHEQGTQTLLTEIRSRLVASPSDVTGLELKSMVPVLVAVIERYPELKASGSFLQLQKAIVDTEQRLALARDYFNEVATFYNTRIQVVPDRLVGALARLRPRPLLSTAEFERAPVAVKLVS